VICCGRLRATLGFPQRPPQPIRECERVGNTAANSANSCVSLRRNGHPAFSLLKTSNHHISSLKQKTPLKSHLTNASLWGGATTPQRDKASGACQSPGNGVCPRGQNRIRIAPRPYRPIDIDRTPQDVSCRGAETTWFVRFINVSPSQPCLPRLHPSVHGISENFNTIGRQSDANCFQFQTRRSCAFHRWLESQ
jgi:hypothetical protein